MLSGLAAGGVYGLVAVAHSLVFRLTGIVAVSAAGYAVAVQPHLLRGSTVAWVASTLALGVFVRSVVDVFFSRPSYVFPDPIPFGKLGNGRFLSVGGASVQARSLFVVLVAIGLAALAVLVMERTRFGRGLRAIRRIGRRRPSSASRSTVPWERRSAWRGASPRWRPWWRLRGLRSVPRAARRSDTRA